MPELRERFVALDDVSWPDLWPAIEARARQAELERVPLMRPRPRWLRRGLVPAAVGIVAVVAAIIVVVPQPRSAFAVLERARERFERRPFHATERNTFAKFVGDDTLVVELWFRSETQWRSTIVSSANPDTPEEAGDFVVFDGTREGRYEVEDNAFSFRPASEVDDPYGASGATWRDPTEGFWPSATGLKSTPEFLDENCRVSQDRVAGRIADKLACDTGSESSLGTVGIWLDRETGFILKISTPEAVREVLSIDYEPDFPPGIFDVVAPKGATLRGEVPGRPSGGNPEASIDLGDHATSVRVGLGAVWAVSVEDAPTPPTLTRGPGENQKVRLHRIDPKTSSVVATIDIEHGSFAVGEGFVWVAGGGRGSGGNLRRLDPATNEFTGSPIPLDGNDPRVEVGEGAVWVTVGTESEQARGQLMRIDPTTGEIRRVALDGHPYGTAIGAGSVWVHTQTFDSADPNVPVNRLYRIDARTLAIEATERPARTPGLAFGEGSLWTLSDGERVSTLTRIDPATNRAVATIDLPPGANRLTGGFAAGGGSVWVVNGEDGTLHRVDATTNRVAGDPIRVGRGAQEVAVGEDAVWVTTYAEGTVARIDL